MIKLIIDKHDPKFSKVKVIGMSKNYWINYLSKYITIVFKGSSIILFLKSLSRKKKATCIIIKKQYPEIAFLYRFIVWSMLWNFLFWQLFGSIDFYFLYFLKFGFDMVFFLKFVSFFLSGKNIDIFILELKNLPIVITTSVKIVFVKKTPWDIK